METPNFGCQDCEHFKRGYTRRGGIYFLNGKMRPRVVTVKPKCEHNVEEFERWVGENAGKPRIEYTKHPDCFIPNKGLQYVLDDLKRHENDNPNV